MNENRQIPPDFAEWIIRSLDGTISAEQFVMLDKEITTNSAARAYYLDLITTYVGLVDLVGVLPKPTVEKFKAHPNLIKTSLNFGPDVSEEEKIHQIGRYAEQQLKIFLAQQHRDIQEPTYRDIGWNLSDTIYKVTETAKWLIKKGIKAAKTTAVCALVAIVILIIILNVCANRTVATLVDSVNAKWNVEIGKDGRIRPTRFRLEEGYARIALKKGAVVILQAPSTFKIQTRNKMFLETGWVTAKVPPEALGFAVKTPVSNVVDFGTEFGIRVRQDGTSDLHLFKGKAVLKWDTGIWSERTLTLTEGQAKRVDKSGQVEDIPIQQYSFVRYFNSETGFIWRGQRLCLVDIVGKGNGLGTGQTNVYVDPIEGYKESIYCSGKGSEYHVLAANPFIDGLFIPDGSKRQIISSQGHVFADCPKTNGECYATLGANPNQGIGYDVGNNLAIRVVDPSAQGTPAFILTDETYIVTGTETGIELMPENRNSNKLGTDTWVHFELGTPVQLAANKQYGFDVTVILGNRSYCFETAGVVEDSYAGGSAYSTGIEGGTNSLHLDEVYDGDHMFVVELAQTGPIEPAQSGPKVSYSATAPEIGSDDVCFLGESTIDNKNVGGFPGQIYSGDNDHATFIARDRRGLGQTFTTGSHPGGYLMKGFWLKNVRYTENLSGGNGTWWYVGATQRRNSIIRFNGQDYGNKNHPCIVMHANLGITFDLSAIRAMCPDIKITHFVSQFGIADFEEQVGCNADFWVLVDGRVRSSRRNVTQKNILSNVSIDLNPSDRFLTLVTTDGGDIDRQGTYQRSFTCDWCVFVGPALILKAEEGTVNMQAK
jgi:hypothetical protein